MMLCVFDLFSSILTSFFLPFQTDDSPASKRIDCTECIAGKYLNVSQQITDVCIDCPRGRYNTLEGQGYFENCTECPLGKSMDDDNDPGQNSDTKCLGCKEGEYNDEFGRLMCKKCPEGTWSNEASLDSADACKSCPLGRKGTVPGLDKEKLCDECPLGFYQNVVRKTICLACQLGRYTDEKGTVHPNFATSEVEACKPCDVGR